MTAGDAAPRIAVAFIAFDRHHLARLTLSRVLRHLPAGWPLRVWQDGEREARSGRVVGHGGRIARNLALFAERGLEVDHEPGRNRGTALTFWAAERWAFETMGADALYIIEDDIVISPHFFTMAERMARLALAEPRIGAFSPFGRADLWQPWQGMLSGRLLPMHHRWAYGITRRYWEASRADYADYLALLDGCDYRDRPHAAIRDWLRSLAPDVAGLNLITGQDGARTAIMMKHGCVSVMTTPSYALNIGKQGMPFTPPLFHLHRHAVKGRHGFYPKPVGVPGRLSARAMERLARANREFAYW